MVFFYLATAMLGAWHSFCAISLVIYTVVLLYYILLLLYIVINIYAHFFLHRSYRTKIKMPLRRCCVHCLQLVYNTIQNGL